MTEAMRRRLADQLRQAIESSGVTLYQLSQNTGVHRSQLSRFMHGKRDLGLAIADKLCAALGLQLTKDGSVVPPASRRQRKPKKPSDRTRKGK
jgi:transcriptional regulator with XRE-family HTH domain